MESQSKTTTTAKNSHQSVANANKKSPGQKEMRSITMNDLVRIDPIYDDSNDNARTEAIQNVYTLIHLPAHHIPHRLDGFSLWD